MDNYNKRGGCDALNCPTFDEAYKEGTGSTRVVPANDFLRIFGHRADFAFAFDPNDKAISSFSGEQGLLQVNPWIKAKHARLLFLIRMGDANLEPLMSGGKRLLQLTKFYGRRK